MKSGQLNKKKVVNVQTLMSLFTYCVIFEYERCNGVDKHDAADDNSDESRTKTFKTL